MRHQTLTSAHALHDLAKTFPFAREDVITTPFSREPVDVDDTVPVALYSRPYERIELQPDSRPYELIEIECEASAAGAPGEDQAPSTWLRSVLTFALLSCALATGFGLALLLL